MITIFRLIYGLGAGLCALGAFLITFSYFLSDRAPQSIRFWVISIAFSLAFLSVGMLPLVIQHKVAVLAFLGSNPGPGDWRSHQWQPRQARTLFGSGGNSSLRCHGTGQLCHPGTDRSGFRRVRLISC